MKKCMFPCLILSLSTLLAGCSSMEMIKSNMDSRSYSMSYVMDSIAPITKKISSVAIGSVSFDPTKMGDKTQIMKEKRFLFPLGIINVWEYHDQCIQGRSMFKDDLPSFLRTSLAREINHSGLVTVDTNKQSEYSIALSIDKIDSEGLYKRSGISLFVFTSRSEIAGPAVSTLTVSYTLKKGDQVVRRNTFSSSKTTEWINRKYIDNATMQRDYAASMVKATAYNFKNASGLIVADLNDYFGKQPR